MARTYNLASGGLRVVLTRKEAEAVARGEQTFVLRAVSASAPTIAPEAPVVESPAPKFACIQPGCYKEGHAFSAVGAFGNGVAKGHFDLNPTHAQKAL